MNHESRIMNHECCMATMELQQIDDYRWRIPRRGGMLVDGIVDADAAMMGEIRNDPSLQQVANVAHLPGIVSAALAMPDIHWGYGFPIGGVAATDVESDGVVSPGGVGFDIGCGVRLLRSSLSWEEVSASLPPLVDALARAVPRGVGGKGLRTLSLSELDRVLAEGA